ncbi:MAG: DNA repair protein RecN [Candidatus Zixiibacteriota bacterium]|nr:MAG: DNA repair protein RecN [candidate division Zixibacteria bacterium]
MILKKLVIHNFALIKQTSMSFQSGLTVLTGETGAGKSVMVNAIDLAIGNRADKEHIRYGCDSSNVEATFENLSEVKQVVVFREISRSGNSKVKINGQTSSVSHLRSLTSPKIQIVSQHSGQLLMNEENHLAFFDHLAGLTAECELVAKLYANWRLAVDELKRVSNRREQLIKERELLLFQVEEIEKAELRIGEEEELIVERSRLDSVQGLMSSSSLIQEILSSNSDATNASSVQDMISVVRRELENMAIVDSTLSKNVEALTEIEYQLEELRNSVEQYGATLRDDPVRLEEVNLRLDEIYKLKKKYGGSEESVLTTLAEIQERLKKLPNIDDLIDSLIAKEKEQRRIYAKKATELSIARRKAAQDIGELVAHELTELSINDAQFKCELVCEEDDDGIVVNGCGIKPTAYGLETVRFLFSANPGEPLKPLVKTASGGEMSRVLLALKSIELNGDRVKESLLVFDEVDAGIGGQTAVEVGRKLKRLSHRFQVIVITHLHQIARLADHHFVAEKKIDNLSDGRTTITIRDLDKEEIECELNRMVALPEKAGRR